MRGVWSLKLNIEACGLKVTISAFIFEITGTWYHVDNFNVGIISVTCTVVPKTEITVHMAIFFSFFPSSKTGRWKLATSSNAMGRRVLLVVITVVNETKRNEMGY